MLPYALGAALMATDRTEQNRRGQSASKTTTKHPFVAIDHRVIDSPAFADLKPSAQVLIFIIARQSKKDNNGHLQATYSWCKRYGIGSEHTLRDSIAQLIAHGFIYRTRSHGANGAWATYAFTWLPITKKEGLFLAGYVANAWRDWKPTGKKTSPQKVQDGSGRNCSFTPQLPAETAGTHPAETADYEYMLPCSAVKRPLYRVAISKPPRLHNHTNSPRPLPKAGKGYLRLAA